MKPRQEVDYKFRERSKFALLTFNNVFVDLPSGAFELSDGTLVLSAVPVPDIGVWKDWIGSIRMERLSRANLVLLVEDASHKSRDPGRCSPAARQGSEPPVLHAPSPRWHR